MPVRVQTDRFVSSNLGSARGALAKRKTAPKGGKYPSSPSTKDGEFEGTAAGKTKRKNF